MEYFRSEIKAGIMIVICVVILGVFIFYVGGFNVLEKRYPIYVRFNFTGGLDEDAPVRFAGVEVGEVEGIRIMYEEDANVELKLSISQDVKLRTDSQAFINTLGFMGEKYVELSPGTKGNPLLKPGDTIAGTDPTLMDELFKKGSRIADELEQTVVDLQKFIEDTNDLIVSNQDDIRRIVINLKETTEHAKEFAKTIEESPWKLIWKTRKKKTEEEEAEPKEREPLRERRMLLRRRRMR